MVFALFSKSKENWHFVFLYKLRIIFVNFWYIIQLDRTFGFNQTVAFRTKVFQIFLFCKKLLSLLSSFISGCWIRANFEGAPSPAPERFAILSLLRLQLRSWLKRAAPLRLQLRDYSDWYSALVLRCHYSPPTFLSIKINFKKNLLKNTTTKT